MKILATIMAICCACFGQNLAQNMQNPQGTFFTEGFGNNGVQPCGYNFNSTGLFAFTGCNVIWGAVTTGTGGAVSIAASPGQQTYPQGSKSLKIVTGTTSTFVQTVGFTPTVSASQSFTITFTSNVTAQAIGAFNAQALWTPIASGRRGGMAVQG